jgi:acylphosphatase
VREASHELGLAGWVRNRPDGSIEVAFDGPADAQDRLIAALRRGPPGARIEGLEHLTADPIDPPITTPFRVVH